MHFLSPGPLPIEISILNFMSEYTAVKSHITGGPTRLLHPTDTFTFRGQKFTITSTCYECVDTGEQFTDTLQDEALVQAMRQQWRERNGVPTPEQLTARRKSLGLSGNEMAVLLGLGINQYRQYEKGDFPSESKARLLQLAVDERALASLLDAARPVLSARALGKLQHYLDQELARHIHWRPGTSRPTTPVLSGGGLRDFVSRQLTDGGCATAQPMRPGKEAGHQIGQPLFS